MSLAEHISFRLGLDEKFQELIGANIFRGKKETEVPIPSVIYHGKLLQNYCDLDGDELARDTTVTFEILAADEDIAEEISNTIQACFYKYTGTAEGCEILEVSLSEDEEDDWSEILNCARRILTLDVCHCAI